MPKSIKMIVEGCQEAGLYFLNKALEGILNF